MNKQFIEIIENIREVQEQYLRDMKFLAENKKAVIEPMVKDVAEILESYIGKTLTDKEISYLETVSAISPHQISNMIQSFLDDRKKEQIRNLKVGDTVWIVDNITVTPVQRLVTEVFDEECECIDLNDDDFHFFLFVHLTEKECMKVCEAMGDTWASSSLEYSNV